MSKEKGKGRQQTGIGARRYPRETKIKAITMVNEGASMCSVGRELGVKANVVKYWVEHADTILGPQGKMALTFDDGLDDYTRQRFHREGWGAIFEALRQSRKKFKDAPLDQITRFIEVLTEKLSRLGAPPKKAQVNGQSAAPNGEQDKAIQEIEVLVARFTKKKDEMEGNDNQRVPPADDEGRGGAPGEVIDVPPENQEEKDANDSATGPT